MKRIKQIIKNRMGPFPAGLNLISEVSWKHKMRILNYNFRHTKDYSPKPLTAKIEINSSCNLKCVMCFRETVPNRNRYMSMQEFRIVLDHLPGLILWSPHGYNEPLLHPRLYDFIAEGNQRGIKCHLVTNGVLLKPNVVDQLLNLNVKKITVSIDAVGKEYERIRFPASFNMILEQLIHLKTVANGREISLAVTIWKNNLDQIPALVQLAEELNFPILFWDIGYTHNFGESIKKNSVRFDPIPFLDEYKNNPLVKFSLHPKSNRSCTLPWSSVYVDVVGDVYPCTDNLHFRIGNLFLNSVEEIFNSQKARRFRKQSYTGQNENCHECISWRAGK